MTCNQVLWITSKRTGSRDSVANSTGRTCSNTPQVTFAESAGGVPNSLADTGGCVRYSLADVIRRVAGGLTCRAANRVSCTVVSSKLRDHPRHVSRVPRFLPTPPTSLLAPLPASSTVLPAPLPTPPTVCPAPFATPPKAPFTSPLEAAPQVSVPVCFKLPTAPDAVLLTLFPAWLAALVAPFPASPTVLVAP